MKKKEELEILCIRCGTCCGAYDGDPCLHLKKDNDGRYYCEVYDSRLGPRKTINGNSFLCVPVRKILNDPWFKSAPCPYKKISPKVPHLSGSKSKDGKAYG